MRFDTADVAFMETNGIFQAVMTHEMGHVIGIGSLWLQPVALPPLVSGPAALGGTDPYFIGASAIAQFNANGGGVYLGIPVPVEAGGGPGTQDSHWRESVMGKELMTGYVSLIANPLSAITVGSLADIGYTVSYVNADPYTVNGVNLQVPGGAGDFHLHRGGARLDPEGHRRAGPDHPACGSGPRGRGAAQRRPGICPYAVVFWGL